MTKTIGKLSRIGIGKEATKGTAVVPTYWLPLTEKNTGIQSEYVANESDYSRIEATVGSEVVYSKGEPSFSGYIFDQSFGLILLSALGSVSTSADTPEVGVNTHTFTLQNDNEHDSLSIVFKDANQDIVFPYSKLSNLTITAEKKAITSYEASFISQKNKTATNTVSDIAENHFNSSHISLKLASTQADLSGASALSIENLTLNIEKEIIEQDSLGSNEPNNIYNGTIGMNVEFEILADSTTYQAMYENGTDQAMEIKLENTGKTIGSSSNPSLAIQFNLIHLEEMEYSISNGELNRYKFTAKAHYKQADTKSMQIVLVNTEASY